MTHVLEFGLDTFGDVTTGADGMLLKQPQVIRNVMEEAILADRVGIDFFGIGEHHRQDFAVSAPEVLLAAIASRTQRIRLGSAVTVLSSDDPIRVFQRFSTLDALSDGRAEVILGRGSFIESFPLFGYDLSKYEELFEDKLDLFSKLATSDTIDYEGDWRSPLKNQQVFPPVADGQLKTWIGVGGSPESVLRAVRHDMRLMLAIIGEIRNGSHHTLRFTGEPSNRPADRPAKSVCIRRVMSPKPTKRRAGTCSLTSRRSAIELAVNAAGRPSPNRTSRTRSSMGPCMPVRPRPWRERLPISFERSASPAFR